MENNINEITDEQIYNDVINVLAPFLKENHYFGFSEEDLNNEIFLLVVETNQELYQVNKESYIKEIKRKIISRYKVDSSEIIADSTKTYLLEIGTYKLLSRDEEIELFTKYRNGDLEAKEEIIKRNLRLVVSVAKDYSKSSIPFIDLIQDGNLGLLKAVDKFDLDRGTKFSTCAVWWIRQSILRALAEKEKPIRIPSWILTITNKIRKYERQYYLENGKEPTNEEIANELEIKLEDVEQLKKFEYDYTSMNRRLNEEDETEFQDVIPSDDSIDDTILNFTLSDEIEKFFKEAKLTKNQRLVIIYRFGLNGGENYSYEKIGKILNRTVGSVKQSEKNAILRLKNCQFKHKIKNYYDEKYDIDEVNKKKLL